MSHWSGDRPSRERRTPGDKASCTPEDRTKSCRALQAETEGPRHGSAVMGAGTLRLWRPGGRTCSEETLASSLHVA